MDQPSEHDVCEELLNLSTAAVGNQELRRSLLIQTTHQLRRQRHLRQVAFAVALAGCYLAGLGTMWLLMYRTPMPNVAWVAAPSMDGTEEVMGQISDAAVLAYDHGVPAPILEHWATIVGEEYRSSTYRQAGDRYLEQTGNLESALRCYARSLEVGSEDTLTISEEEDNWLLMALKMSRR